MLKVCSLSRFQPFFQSFFISLIAVHFRYSLICLPVPLISATGKGRDSVLPSLNVIMVEIQIPDLRCPPSAPRRLATLVALQCHSKCESILFR